MTDILLTNTLDLAIGGNDLLLTADDTDTDYQDLNLILNINTGDNKQYPLMGTNLISWKNGDLTGLLSKLNTQFQLVGLNVQKLYSTDNDTKLAIKLQGNYTFVDISVL